MQARAQRSRAGGEEGVRAVVAKNTNTNTFAAHSAKPHLLAYPLRSDEVAPAISGSFSLVLSAVDTTDIDNHTWVCGVGWRSDSARPDDRDLVGLPHLRAATADAIGRAGVADARAMDTYELHDYTADAELLACEAVGLCGDGEAPELAVAGNLAAVNQSGGSLSGEAPFGGSMRKVIATCAHLSGGDRALGLIQIAGGLVGQFQTVIVLGREKPL
jgi:hypothetical protein